MAKRKTAKKVTKRNPIALGMIFRYGASGGAGSHQNRNFDIQKGYSRKPKHKKNLKEE